MKKKYTGGFAAIVFALGFLLSQFWNFGGLGTGENQTADSESSSESDSDANTDVSTASVSAGGNLETSMTATPADPSKITENFVTVAIHEDRFRLTTQEDPHEGVDIPLDEIVSRVKKAEGGDQGIKLRILFQKNAQEGSLADLHAALTDAGIQREQIQEISGFID